MSPVEVFSITLYGEWSTWSALSRIAFVNLLRLNLHAVVSSILQIDICSTRLEPYNNDFCIARNS